MAARAAGAEFCIRVTEWVAAGGVQSAIAGLVGDVVLELLQSEPTWGAASGLADLTCRVSDADAAFAKVRVCVCACAYVRACVRACVRARACVC